VCDLDVMKFATTEQPPFRPTHKSATHKSILTVIAVGIETDFLSLSALSLAIWWHCDSSHLSKLRWAIEAQLKVRKKALTIYNSHT
jgi:hypothetical protein